MAGVCAEQFTRDHVKTVAPKLHTALKAMMVLAIIKGDRTLRRCTDWLAKFPRLDNAR